MFIFKNFLSLSACKSVGIFEKKRLQANNIFYIYKFVSYMPSVKLETLLFLFGKLNRNNETCKSDLKITISKVEKNFVFDNFSNF